MTGNASNVSATVTAADRTATKISPLILRAMSESHWVYFRSL